jgi:hypothetical protein
MVNLLKHHTACIAPEDILATLVFCSIRKNCPFDFAQGTLDFAQGTLDFTQGTLHFTQGTLDFTQGTGGYEKLPRRIICYSTSERGKDV